MNNEIKELYVTTINLDNEFLYDKLDVLKEYIRQYDILNNVEVTDQYVQNIFLAVKRKRLFMYELFREQDSIAIVILAQAIDWALQQSYLEVVNVFTPIENLTNNTHVFVEIIKQIGAELNYSDVRSNIIEFIDKENPNFTISTRL